MDVFIFVLGLFIGSFLGVLGWRIPKGKPVVWGRSRCDFCGKTLSWWELLPVISYVLQHGRCAHCRHTLSFLYPFAELATGIGLFVLFRGLGGLSPLFVLASVIYAAFVVLFVADVLYQILPDSALWVALLGILGLSLLDPTFPWKMHILAAFGACAFFAFLYGVTRGRGMGFGDVKLAFVLGFLLGYPAVVVGLYAAFLTGAGVGVILVVRRNVKLKSKIAFGPFLLLGAAIALLWSEKILDWWRRLLV